MLFFVQRMKGKKKVKREDGDEFEKKRNVLIQENEHLLSAISSSKSSNLLDDERIIEILLQYEIM